MVTLTINGAENYESNHPLITIGRGADNNVSIPADSNISRYHARIEQREDGYWFCDQGSSNGSSVNGNAVESEMLLEPGDEILLGGTSRILFATEDAADEDDDEQTSGSSGSAVVAHETPEKSKSSSTMMLLAGTVVGLALVSVAVAGVVFWKYSGGSRCEASARVISPRSGEVLTQPTDIQIEVTNSQCVEKVIYLLKEKEIGSSSKEPFSISLDPKEYPELANGGAYELKFVLLDAKGAKIAQPDGIMLAFETLATPTPTPEVIETTAVKTPGGGKPAPAGKTVSAIETKQLGEKLVTTFLGGIQHNYDAQFWTDVSKRVPEYTVEGYYARARANNYYEVINVAYASDRNLDAAIGYILAMSRSKFVPTKQGANEGLWQMSNEFVMANALNASCGTETIGDISQNCAAKASAEYLSGVYNVFDRDIIFTIASFGMSTQEAAAWKEQLGNDRRAFTKLLSAKQRDEVVRFFAAGIVTENPQRFGLKRDRPLSELYRITMIN